MLSLGLNFTSSHVFNGLMLLSGLGCKEIKPVNFQGNQSWIFIRRTDAEAEALVLWPPDAKNWLLGKDPDAGKDWRQQEKGATEDEMVGWHHWLDGYEFEQALGIGDGQGSLACCSLWLRKESDTTERLNLCFQLSLPFRFPRCNVQLIFPTGATYEHILLLTAYSTGASRPKLNIIFSQSHHCSQPHSSSLWISITVKKYPQWCNLLPHCQEQTPAS